MSNELITIQVSIATHKRLKLLSIVEKMPIEDVLDELVKVKYGEHQAEIEQLIQDANVPTKLKGT